MTLVLDRVVAGYEGTDILKETTLSIKRGSITCIVGPNGAGKSTLLRVISGHLKPRQGTITFNGQSLTGMSSHQLLGFGIRLVEPQSLFLDMTVEENVRLGGYLLDDKITVNQRFKNIEAQFPLIRTRAQEKAGSLSGGQQRIVEFARSLMLDPILLLLDEPSVGLDPKALQQMLATIKRVNKLGKTILLVEQNVQAGFSIATHGIVMENGRVHLEGSPQQLLAHPELTNLFFKGSSEHSPSSLSSPFKQKSFFPEKLVSTTMIQSNSSPIQESKTASSTIVLLSTRSGGTFRVTQHEMRVMHHVLSLACGSLLLPIALPDTRSPLELFSDDNFYQEFFDQFLWPLLNQVSTHHAGICLTVSEEALKTVLRSSETASLSHIQIQELWKVTLERYVALLAGKIGIPLLHLGKHLPVLPTQQGEEMLSGTDPSVKYADAQNQDNHNLQMMLSDFLSRYASTPAFSLPASQDALRTWVREQDLALLHHIKPIPVQHTTERTLGPQRYTREAILARKRKMHLMQSRKESLT